MWPKSKKKKGPRSLVDSALERTPKSQYHDDWREMRPSWGISLLEMVDPFGWHIASAEEMQQVRAKLAAFESMTWKQILYEGGYRNHFIGKDRICPEALARLVALGQDDVDSVMSLGITQMGRVFGIMEHNVLKVLWWDPNHQVCPVEH